MADARNAYRDVGVTTASPNRLLLMLWDRLIRDLDTAMPALGSRDVEAAHEALVHAQDIVFELRSSLRVDAWAGGPGLASLYDYVAELLVRANAFKDLDLVRTARSLLLPLRDAFHAAAASSAAASPTTGDPGSRPALEAV